MSISDRLENLRDRLYDAGESFSRRVLSDGPRPVSSAVHREASVHLEKGRKSFNSKDFSRAEEGFRAAIDLDPAYVKAYYYLGLALYKQDDAQAAIRAWTRSIQIDPGDPMAQKSQRKLNYIKGKVTRTIDELEDRLGN